MKIDLTPTKKIKVTNVYVIAEMSDGQNVILELPVELENKINDFAQIFEQELNDKVEQLRGE